jgi:penicillin-binding protein 1A
VRIALALVLSLVALTTWVYLGPLPSVAPAPLQTAFVYDREGRLIAELRPEENRVVVPLHQMPVALQDAVVAAEDRRFFDHPGVDIAAIVRAAWADLTGGTFQGGSTITQQLVKNLYLGSERSLWRKIREAVYSIRYEREFSKDEILERYLNTVYLGHGAYGVEAASRLYFDAPVEDLTLAQAATLAGIVAAPERYSPRRNPEGAVARRNWVLDRMAAIGSIARFEALAAKQEPLEVEPERTLHAKAPYFVEYLRRAVIQDLGFDEFYRGGLRIETTLDLDLQRHAEDVVQEVLNQPGDPQAALVAIDVRTGGILAMVGGRNFKRSEVNLATGEGGTGRQAGSAFKPFTLAQALDEGISQYRVYPAPSQITLGDWTPHNYGDASYGALSVRSATIHSVNTVFAQLILDVGPSDVAELAHDMGIQSELPEDGTLTLGSASVTPLEMTNAFATFATAGVHRPATGIDEITDSDEEILRRLDRGGDRVLGEQVALLTTDILTDVVNYGTGTAARLPDIAVAGKTGTTNDNTDAWFCGYTTEVATCVWVGYPSGQIPMDEVHGITVTGGSFPAEIWRRFMEALPPPKEGFEAPAPTTAPSPTSTPTALEQSPESSPSPTSTSSPSPSPGGGGGVIPPIFEPSPSPSPSPSGEPPPG